MTYGELYLWARQELMKTEPAQSAGLIARDLICTFSQKNAEAFLLNQNASVDSALLRRVQDGVVRLQNDEPLAYVLGEWEFYGLPMLVSPDVLIPRDDTCAVAELAIRTALFLEEDPRILDLCCGSGCIGIAVASRVKDARVALGDVSKEALAIAKKNVALNKLGGRISCIPLDVRVSAPSFLGKYDMIISNPPYITEAEMAQLPASVKNFEPDLALFGGVDGLDFYRDILHNYTNVLKPGGYVCFEFGMGQGDDVCRLLEENGYSVLERVKDFNDRERAVLAQHGGKGI